MQRVDYLVVGSGLTGAVIARALADAGREVLVVDRRQHLGGNVHDHTHPSGVRVHTYGPHYFRTSSRGVWEFATRFAPFYKYEPALLTRVDGVHEPWPLSAARIVHHAGQGWRPGFTGRPANFEEAALSLMPRVVYERFVKEYTEKQWGAPAHTLSAQLCKRFTVRQNGDPRLTQARFQGIPRPGYAAWMRAMLDGVPVRLNHDYLERRGEIEACKLLVFTGPIDAFFDHDLGRLHYRGQRREHTYLPDAGFAQPCGQVNNPRHGAGPHVRTLEWKHMMATEEAAGVRGTVLTRETPFSPDDPGQYEYPYPDEANARLYAAYRARAGWLDKVMVCGRLGEYRYYDMDQAIARALSLAGRVLRRRSAPEVTTR